MKGAKVRDRSSEADVDDEDSQPLEAMVAMAMAFGVSADILFGDGENS